MILAYRRDASWHNTIGRAWAYHMPSETVPCLAACSRQIMLILEDGYDAEQVPEFQRCRRAACQNRWPPDPVTRR